MTRMTSTLILLVLLLALLFASALSQAATVFSASFDKGLDADGVGGYRLSAPVEVQYEKGRLGQAVRVEKGKGPVIFAGGKVALAAQGCVSFWVGSVDVKGQEKANINFLTLKQGELTLRIFKASDGNLYAMHEIAGGKSACYRYPLYDLQPAYPGMGDAHDIRHFILYQWGGNGAGLYVNGIAADAAVAKMNPADSAVRDGELMLGDKNAGLYFDEAVVSDSTKSAREVTDNFVSYLTGSYSLPLPQINVTEHRGTPITIDGNLSDDEWKDASALGGIHELNSRSLLPYEATFYFTYDKDKFYIGMKSFADYPLNAGAGKLKSIGEDFGVCMDDCMEVLLMPYESIRYDYFHFLGNSAGYYADQLGTNPAWDGHYEYKTQVHNGVWTAEIAIPYANLRSDADKAQYPKGDGMWRFNVTRNWDGALTEHWAALCYCGTYGDFGKFGLMSFEKDGVSPRFNGLVPGKDAVTINFEVVNLGTTTRKLSASALGFVTVLPFTEARESFELKAGERKTLSLNVPLQGQAACALEWGITDADTGKYLLRGSGRYPAVEGRAEAYKAEVIERERLQKELERTQQAPVAKPEETKATETKSAAILWPTPDVVDSALTKRLQWKNNTLGITDQVPAPWTATTEHDGKIAVWGRTYNVKNALILGGAAIKGEEMLAGPVALVLEKGGKQTRYEKAATTVTDIKAGRVEFVAVGGDARLTVSTKSYIEYDGCMWVEMKLLPHEKIAFDKMWLEIPVKSAVAPDFNYWIDKESGSNCGKVPTTGLSVTYRPYVWLGSAERGISWFNEEYREWFIEEPEKTQMTFIEPGPRGVTRMKVMLAVTPNTLESTLTTEFGLMGTPIKPMPKNWRLYDNYCGWSKLKGQFAEWGTGYFIKEPDDPEDFTRRLQQYDKANPYTIALPNCGSYFFTETNYKDGRAYPDYWMWCNEFAPFYNADTKVGRQLWQPPSDPKTYQVGYTSITPSREFADWYLYNYHKLLTDYPLLKGVYMDTCIPVGNNRLNGTGFTDRYGKSHPTIQIMNSRQFCKRLYTMFWQMRGNPDEHPWVIYIHCSNQICPPIHAFASSYLQGEGLSVGPRAFGDHPLNALPMEALQVGFNGHAYGWIEQFLGLYTENMETSGELAAMFFMHDHNEFGRGDLRTQARYSTVLQRAGLVTADENITFIPYWNNQGAVVSLTDGGYVNAYIKTKEGRTILAVASLKLDNAPTQIDIKIDRHQLALPAGPLTLTDLYTGESATVAGNQLSVAIRKNDFRVFEVK